MNLMIKKIYFIICLFHIQFVETSSYLMFETAQKSKITKNQKKYDLRTAEKESIYAPKSTNTLIHKIEPKYITFEETKIKNREEPKEKIGIPKQLAGDLIKTNLTPEISFKNQTYQEDISKNIAFEKNNQKTKLSIKDSSIALKDSLIKIPTYVYDQFTMLINKMTFSILKKSIFISPHKQSSQFNFTDIIATPLKKYLFVFLQLPAKIDTKTKTGQALHDFKIELQFLTEQINSYSGKKYYTHPDQMLDLIKIINRFIQKAHIQPLSFKTESKLIDINTQATTCCNIFKNQNIIFSTQTTPEQILSFFEKPINNISDLNQAQYAYNAIDTIYEDKGYIDQILQTWQDYQNSQLYKDKINKEYGAFITFLLIFDNSIIAAANLLEQTSALYKVTSPTPVIININQN